MIFMSESGLLQRARESKWDRWYVEHLRIMSTVPGVHTTQRFKCAVPGHPPSLAMYSIASAAVFDDPYYLSVRGMGEWLPLIDRHWYRRNLFDGAAAAPPVRNDQVLLVCDRAAPCDAPPGLDVLWLRGVGLDRTTAWRGIAVIGNSVAPPPGYALYRPVTAQQTPP